MLRGHSLLDKPSNTSWVARMSYRDIVAQWHINNLQVLSGTSSDGRSRPCQGRGHEFEPRYPLQISNSASARRYATRSQARFEWPFAEGHRYLVLAHNFPPRCFYSIFLPAQWSSFDIDFGLCSAVPERANCLYLLASDLKFLMLFISKMSLSDN